MYVRLPSSLRKAVLCIALFFLVLASPHAWSQDMVQTGSWLTVYRQGGAAMRRVFKVQLEQGLNEVATGKVAEMHSAESAILSPLSAGLKVLSRTITTVEGGFELMWTVSAEASGVYYIELSCAITGISWSVRYSALLAPTGDSASLMAWVEVTNSTSQAIIGSRTTLISSPSDPFGVRIEGSGSAGMGLFSWTYPQDVSVGPRSSVAYELMAISNVPARIGYCVFPDEQAGPPLEGSTGRREDRPVISTLDIAVSKGACPQIPLPRGVLQVYSVDRDGVPYLLGQDRQGIPVGVQTVSARLGAAEGLRAERVRTDQRRVGTSTWEEAYQIRITNARKAQAEVTVLESFPGEWTILQSAPVSWARSQTGLARTTVMVPAGGQIEILYRVRYTV